MDYYITGIMGTGKPFIDPYRSTITKYPVNGVAVIPVNSVTGVPLFTWAVAAVPSSADQTAILADPTIDHLPITSLDQTIGSLTAAQRNTLQSLGTKYSVPRVSGLTAQNTCRDALNAFGQALDPHFDSGTFAVL